MREPIWIKKELTLNLSLKSDSNMNLICIKKEKGKNIYNSLSSFMQCLQFLVGASDELKRDRA